MIHISVQDPTQFNHLVNRLEDEGIPNLISIQRDSAFPALNDTQQNGIIRVSSAYKGAVLNIVEELSLEVHLEELPDDGPNESGQKSPNYLAIVLGIALVLCFLAFLRERSILSRSSEDKNFWYEWSAAGNSLDMVNKSSGTVAIRYFDDNFNFNYEKAETYNEFKQLCSISYDEDEDGFYERVVYYGEDGSYTGVTLDASGRTLPDYLEMILESGDTLRLYDQNENGIWERK